MAAAPAFASSGPGSVSAAGVTAERFPTGDGIRTTLIEVTSGGPGPIRAGQLLLAFDSFSGDYDQNRIASQGPWRLVSVGMNAWFEYAADLAPGTHVLPNVSAAWSYVPPRGYTAARLYFDNVPVPNGFGMIFW